MTKTRETFTTPVGRLVMGDCFEAQTKDHTGAPRLVKSGPNIGQPNPQFYIGVAFPKMLPNPTTGVLETNHEFNAFYALLDRVARAEWPNLFPTPGAPCVNPNFAFKVRDGDGVDRTTGKSLADREGWAGCWIVSFSSAYAPKVVQPVGGAWQAITDKAAVKRGYFVRVAGSVTGNGSPQTPGLFVNLDMIELAGYGPEIVTGPDAASAFGSAPAAPIPGMTATPQLGAGLPAAGAPPVPGVGAPAMPPVTPAAVPGVGAPAMPPVAPAAVPGYTGYMGVPGATPGAPAAPLPGTVPNAASPALPAVPPSPSAPVAMPSPSRVMTAAAAGQAYESFVAAGWTDELLVANGYMIVQ